jgi:hypothetical protein
MPHIYCEECKAWSYENESLAADILRATEEIDRLRSVIKRPACIDVTASIDSELREIVVRQLSKEKGLVELLEWVIGSLYPSDEAGPNRLTIKHSIGPNAWLAHVRARLSALVDPPNPEASAAAKPSDA